MKLKLSSDGSKLTLNESSPWVQGIIGFVFAAAGTAILVAILTTGMQTVRHGEPVPPSPAAYFGALAFCSLFIVLGVTILFYRQGTTFDRETREAVVWWRLLVPLRSRRHDLRRYTTAWLSAEVREAPRRNTTNETLSEPRLYYWYLLRLTEPRGSDLQIGQTGSAEDARAALRQIAEFLGLEISDTSTDAPPIPAQGVRVGIELPGIGRVSVGEPRPQMPRNAYRFRECLDQPPDSRVEVETHPDGVTLKVPRAGLLAGNTGRLAFGLIWSAATGSIGCFLLSAFLREGKNIVMPGIGIGVMVLIGVGMVASAINMSLRRAVLAVVKDRLMVLQTGPLGSKQHEWGRDELKDVVAGPSGMSSSAGPVIELQIESRRHKPFGMLAGHDEAELRWLATVLRQQLGLSEGQTGTES